MPYYYLHSCLLLVNFVCILSLTSVVIGRSASKRTRRSSSGTTTPTQPKKLRLSSPCKICQQPNEANFKESSKDHGNFSRFLQSQWKPNTTAVILDLLECFIKYHFQIHIKLDIGIGGKHLY
jgi:hypothetical protein